MEKLEDPTEPGSERVNQTTCVMALQVFTQISATFS